MELFPGNRLVLATRNEGKVREMQRLLEGRGVEVTTAAALGLPEVEETGTSFEENATLKAESAVKASGFAVLADDSGLSADALGGAPGVYSADWGGPERDFGKAMARLGREVKAAGDDRGAKFVSVLVLLWPDGRRVEARGEVRGTLVFPPRGEGGFGYDPCFIPEGEDRTFGEMAAEEKARFSHRSRAMEALMRELLG
ncbi:RdgB/HAM1 family non-canonical purine NTP pyrophosphatase [Parvularcula lutaonensis]|uniref:dITP/XTP pyrophosphatase n=1 Tax=Parvularcula lutaonensis TaxID=491923 RepID=A0ABV7MBI0_9PROT|nr:RdgB/HAM1 family non-canonical purine NTP pyrophosphatase [Parvularcula lutaonensis]GGY37438.1 non-canonical purine NTP pyrophosphatase [Parvularcula lutaonensis]